MTTQVPRDWRALSEAASREQDPEKLLKLVKELNEALAERDKLSRPTHVPSSDKSSALATA